MKTYQLLRNNKSMGYYTKTCLLQIGLQPLDLLWVEGESITWKYPSELEDFKGFVPQAAHTEATVVHNRKEKQILYFDSHIAEMDYKKVNIQYITEPDAVLCDVAPGYEYLVRAQNFRLSGYGSDSKAITVYEDLNEGHRPVETARAILNRSNIVQDESWTTDVPEYKADPQSFTIVWEVKKEEMEYDETGAAKGSKWRLLKNGRLGMVITGLIAFASAACINLKF